MTDNYMVTSETVNKAIEALKANGEKVSTRAIRNKLGGGSPNTILKFLQKYKAETPEISIDLGDALRPIMEAASLVAKTIFTKGEEASREGIKELEEDRDYFSAELARSERKNESLQEKFDTIMAKLVRVESDYKIAKENWDKDRSDLKAALDEAAQLRNRAEDLKEAREEAANFREKSAKFEERLESKENQISELKVQLETALADNRMLTEKMAILEGRIIELSKSKPA
jgi:chromosome segregation ATPase